MALEDDEIPKAVLADYRTAPIDEKLRATLAYLEKMTLSPHELGPEDAKRARDAGVGAAALEDAILVCFAFNLVDRVSDALDFEVISPEDFRKSGRALLTRGYRI